MPVRVIGDWGIGSAAGGGGAPTIDSSSLLQPLNAGDAVTTISTLTIGASANFLEVRVSYRRDPLATITSVTWNTVGLTQVGTTNESVSKVQVDIWRLVAPTTGNHNLVITADAVITGYANLTSWIGVNQTTPCGTFAPSSGTTTPVTVNASSATNDVVIDVVGTSFSTATLVVGAGQTPRWNNTNLGEGVDSAGSDEAGAATVTMSWTSFAGDGWAIGAVALKPL